MAGVCLQTDGRAAARSITTRMLWLYVSIQFDSNGAFDTSFRSRLRLLGINYCLCTSLMHYSITGMSCLDIFSELTALPHVTESRRLCKIWDLTLSYAWSVREDAIQLGDLNGLAFNVVLYIVTGPIRRIQFFCPFLISVDWVRLKIHGVLGFCKVLSYHHCSGPRNRRYRDLDLFRVYAPSHLQILSL